jgi:uncharacterized membrane protein
MSTPATPRAMIVQPDSPLWPIFLISLVFLLGAVEVGHWIGQKTRGRSSRNLSTLLAAVFGLLALMISFTFSLSLSRFDARRADVLEEANAIHQTALRARLLPAPYGGDSLKLLRDYAQLHLELAQKVPTDREMQAAIDRSNAIQEALWQQVKAVAAKDNAMVPTGIYIQTLNNMIDAHEKRLTHSRSYVPGIVMIVLYGIAIFTLGLLGYISWADARSSRVPEYLVSVVFASVLLLIQDLERPNGGFIGVSQQPMVDTVNRIAGYACIN